MIYEDLIGGSSGELGVDSINLITIDTDKGGDIRVFTSSSFITVSEDITVRYVLIGGGASGASNNGDAYSAAHAGGGGSGYVKKGVVTLLKGVVYQILIGAGGIGVLNANGNDGSPSIFFGDTALGGLGGKTSGIGGIGYKNGGSAPSNADADGFTNSTLLLTQKTFKDTLGGLGASAGDRTANTTVPLAGGGAASIMANGEDALNGVSAKYGAGSGAAASVNYTGGNLSISSANGGDGVLILFGVQNEV